MKIRDIHPSSLEGCFLSGALNPRLVDYEDNDELHELFNDSKLNISNDFAEFSRRIFNGFESAEMNIYLWLLKLYLGYCNSEKEFVREPLRQELRETLLRESHEVIRFIELSLLSVEQGYQQREDLICLINHVECYIEKGAIYKQIFKYLIFLLNTLVEVQSFSIHTHHLPSFNEVVHLVENSNITSQLNADRNDIPKMTANIADYAFIIAAIKEAEIIDKLTTDKQSVHTVRWKKGEGKVGSFCTTRGHIVKKEVAPSEKVLNAVQYIAERVHESNAKQVQKIIKTLQERIEPYKK